VARTAIADMPSRDVRRQARSVEKRNRDAPRVGGPPCRVLHPNQTRIQSHREKQSLAYIALIAAARRRRFCSLKIRSRLTDIRSGIAWLTVERFPPIIMSSSMERNPIPRLPKLLPSIFRTGAVPACTSAQRLVPNQAVCTSRSSCRGRREHIAVEHP
jgi:hypothetical protein